MKQSFMSRLFRRLPLAASVVCLLASSAIAAEKFSVDADHSKVGFFVTLVGVTEVEGRFSDFSGTIMYDEADLTKSSVTAIIKSASINTGSSFRDKDLKAAPFFDADKFPTIRFQSTAIRKQGNDYVMAGLLTIRDVSKEIQAPLVWLHHKMNDPWKNSRIAFDSRLKLNRKDFGVLGPKFWNEGIAGTVDIDLRITAEIPNFDLWGFPAAEGKKSIGALVYETVQKEGLNAALQQYKETKQIQPDAFEFGPGQLNLVGYRLLQHGKVKEALEFFKLNADSYPDKAFAYDSLGDAYLANGDKQQAAKNFKKSLELDGANTSAIESLRSLGAG
ncbi:MAG TPA: YceI family protein [Candidatus Angelobacter sp.]|nr:YceI family protein [Candidatus Angelobacter sp.]